MKDMCCRVRQNDPSLRLADGHYWVPPVNPISKTLGSTTEPDSYYLSNLWVYIFDPLKQCRHLMSDDGRFECIYCSSRNTIYKRYDWRPAHGFGMNIEVEGNVK